MKYDFTGFYIIARGETEKKAASVFADEIKKRTGKTPEILEEKQAGCYVEFVMGEKGESDSYSVSHKDTAITVTACRLRALIFGAGLFIRKSEIKDGKITLVRNLTGTYTPSMRERGHQLSYTDMNNTYDAWTKEQFRQYFIDLMLFGNNTFESDSGGKGEENKLMHYTRREAMRLNSITCDELDLEFSVWHPLSTDKTDEDTLEELRETYGALCKLNVLFPPGGDPGNMLAEDFIERCKVMKRELVKFFPNAKMYPSAQAPHEYPDWGERFARKMEELPEEIDGIIYGPNHAMPIDDLRRKINKRYPFRYYPDVTHNVRCETPVHFQQDDWHFALAATLSRESVNPRPKEYRILHRVIRPYVEGSVSYSEGVNDDLNKFVWSAMDFDTDCDLRESVRDYVRAFYCGVDVETLTELFFALEENWACDPAENASIDRTYDGFRALEKKHPELMENWRFVLHLFRACCDKLVRDRRIFELGLIAEAKQCVVEGNTEKAVEILRTDFSDGYKALREELFTLAQKLFELIGIQLDVEHFGGMAWERGCTLDTIDNPVTDRKWLLKKLEADPENAADYFNRNKVQKDEYYFSFADQGFEVCGRQEGEFYMNFQGDSNRDAKLPMCMTKVFDHFNFKTKVAGLTGGDYKLRMTYMCRRIDENINHHKLCINGTVIHDGGQFGGVRDEAYEKKYLADGFMSIVYDIPAELLVNGCAELEITEPTEGFMICEYRFTKA